MSARSEKSALLESAQFSLEYSQERKRRHLLLLGVVGIFAVAGLAVFLLADASSSVPPADSPEHTVSVAFTNDTGKVSGMKDVYVIKTATYGPDIDPIQGGGTWILNRPNGYYVGRLLSGEQFVSEFIFEDGSHFGRTLGVSEICGYVLKSSLDKVVGQREQSCSQESVAEMFHRMSIGKDYATPASKRSTDGVPVRVTSDSAILYYNYYFGSDFPYNGGHWEEPSPHPLNTTVNYVYSSLDGLAAIVQDRIHGLGFVSIDDIEKPSVVYNDND